MTLRGCFFRARGAAGRLGVPAAMLAAAIALSACGGGGGGAAPSGEPPPPPAPEEMPAPAPSPPPVSEAPSDPPPPLPDPEPPLPPLLPIVAAFENHSEYFQEPFDGNSSHYGLRSVRAAWAYARIRQAQGGNAAPGTGVTIAVIDTGLDLNHWEFAGARLERIMLDRGGGTGDDGSQFSHGTAVASVIVAQRGNAVPPTISPQFNFHGAAWGARVKVFPIPLGSGGGGRPYSPITLDQLRGQDMAIAALLRAVLADPDGIDIVNMSFSYQGLIENYTAAQLRANLPDFIRVAAQGRQGGGRANPAGALGQQR